MKIVFTFLWTYSISFLIFTKASLQNFRDKKQKKKSFIKKIFISFELTRHKILKIKRLFLFKKWKIYRNGSSALAIRINFENRVIFNFAHSFIWNLISFYRNYENIDISKMYDYNRKFQSYYLKTKLRLIFKSSRIQI